MNGYAPGQMRKIFSFTFSQNVRSRGYRVFTVLIALLMIVVIPAVMAVAANNKKKMRSPLFHRSLLSPRWKRLPGRATTGTC